MGRLPIESSLSTLLIDQAQPMRVYALHESTLYRSDDAGQTWQATGGAPPEDRLVGVALDPRYLDRLLGATQAGMIVVSEDGGSSWQAPSESIVGMRR